MEATLEQLPDSADAAPAAAPAVEARPQVPARLIEYAPGCHIALPPHTTYALIENPAIVAVPGAARHACGLLRWQEELLPALDLDTLLHPEVSTAAAAPPRYALVVAYQNAPRAPLSYGAIVLQQLPQTVAVSDDALCALPDDSELWPLLALSCFRHEQQAVPILDTARLFAAHRG